MAKIRHEINLLNGILTTPASSAVSNEYVAPNSSNYNGTLTYYFEVTVNNLDSVSRTINLVSSSSGTISIISVPANTSAYTTYKTQITSNSVYINGSNNLYVSITGNASATGAVNVKTARLIIIQDTGTSPITTSETQIDIGNNEQAKTVTTTGTLQPLANPKYWYYDASKWDGQCSFNIDVSWLVSSTTGNKTIVLQQSDGTADGFTGWTTVATIVNAASGATTVARVRTSFTPVDGRNYRIAWTNSSSMTTVSIFNAKIVVTQLCPSNQSSTNLVSYYNANSNSQLVSQTTFAWKASQSFTGNGEYITSVRVNTLKFGTATGVVTCTIQGHQGVYATSSTPNGTIISTATNTIDISTIPTTAGWVTFNFNPIQVTNGAYYTLVLDVPSTAASSSAYIQFTSGNTATNSSGNTAIHNGTSWTAYATYDIYHEIYSTPSPVTITKLQEQYLLVNSAYAATVNTNMGYATTFDPSDWSGVVTTFNHILDGSNDMNTTVGLYDASNTLITGSNVYNPDNQKMSNVTGGNISVNQGGFNCYQGNLLNIGQIFFGASKPLTSASVWIKKTGTPTGTITAKLYATTLVSGSVYTVTGTALATSTNTISIASLTTTNTLYKFTFSGSSILTSGTRYAIVFEQTPTGTSDVSNYISFDGNPSSGSQAPGNFLSQNTSGGAWTTDVNADLCWIMEGDAGMTMPATAQSVDSRVTLNAVTIYATRINVDISPILDTTPPSVPTGLTEISTTYNSTTISWTASTDNIAVTGYDVAVNGVYNKSVTATNATITGLTYLTTYNITVRAKDGVGNTSAYSTALSITTLDRPAINLNGNFFIFFN